MAVQRDHPYTQFNFLVDLGVGDAGSIVAGFAEVSGLENRLDVIEYRNGNSRVGESIKIVGRSHVGNVTLRRGLTGSLDLWQWFTEVRAGGHDARRDVAIHLLDENRDGPVWTWQLTGARPIAYVSGPLDAGGSDLAIEELVLACERFDIE